MALFAEVICPGLLRGHDGPGIGASGHCAVKDRRFSCCPDADDESQEE
jgi:hypothetical protein